MFVLAYQCDDDDDDDDDNYVNEKAFNKFFLPKFKIEKYNVEIDGRNFYDQAINDSINQNDGIRKISTGQRDDYTTSCLLDFAYFQKSYRLIAINLSKQKTLDADPKAIQQVIFTGKALNNTIRIYYILEQSKETILEFAKRTTKVL